MMLARALLCFVVGRALQDSFHDSPLQNAYRATVESRKALQDNEDHQRFEKMLLEKRNAAAENEEHEKQFRDIFEQYSKQNKDYQAKIAKWIESDEVLQAVISECNAHYAERMQGYLDAGGLDLLREGKFVPAKSEGTQQEVSLPDGTVIPIGHTGKANTVMGYVKDPRAKLEPDLAEMFEFLNRDPTFVAIQKELDMRTDSKIAEKVTNENMLHTVAEHEELVQQLMEHPSTLAMHELAWKSRLELEEMPEFASLKARETYQASRKAIERLRETTRRFHAGEPLDDDEWDVWDAEQRGEDRNAGAASGSFR